MKLLRYGPLGSEKPGILDGDENIRDLSAHIEDLDGDALGDESLSKLAALDVSSLPLVEGKPRIGACIGKVGKFIGIGLNFSDHAAEAGMDLPKHPMTFLKATSSICGPNDDIEIPRGSRKTDWEVELGVVIGARAKYVSEADALKHVAGYCVVNDISERAFQIELSGQFTKGKSHDTFGPVGPWLVTRDEINDPQNLDMWLDVDGVRRQTGNSNKMVFGVATVISHLSQLMTLHPGDIITTGTPPGVGMGQKPKPIFLTEGQVMTLGVEGLGVQSQKTIQV